MPWDPVRNFAKVLVKGYYGTTETIINLQLGEGNKLPDPSTEGAFNMVWWNATDYNDPSDDPYKEIVRVIAKNGDTLYVNRGQENTTPQPHNISGKTYKMMLTLTKKTYEDLQTIEVYKDGTLIGQRGSLDFIGFQTIIDDASLKRIKVYAPYRFGGDGSDGDLIINTGTTIIDLQNQPIVVKNYNSISITGTGQLTFINPHPNGTIIILKSKNDVVLTSSATPNIDVSGLGASATLKGNNILLLSSLNTNNGGNGSDNYAGEGGIGIGKYDISFFASRIIFLTCGGGGGNGYTNPSGSGSAAGVGGRGGGALLIEVGGKLNFTGSIYANGQPGQDVSAAYWAAGGGGGAGGSVLILYNDLIANTGTIQCKGGRGGNTSTGSGSGTAPIASGGGGGANRVNGGSGYREVGSGSGTRSGNAGQNDIDTGGPGGTTNSTGTNGPGGGGAGGWYAVIKNRFFF